MQLPAWLNECERSYAVSGNRFTPEDRSVLLSKVSLPSLSAPDKGFLEYGLGSALDYGANLNAGQQRVAEKAAESMFRYVFHQVANGGTFGDLGRVKEKFGKTLEENYPSMSAPFRQLAQAYWTFKIEVADLFPKHHDKLIAQVLVVTEGAIGSVFFPSPGVEGLNADALKFMEKEGWPSAQELRKLRPSVQEREQSMRRILAEYAPELDSDQFIHGNPILVRDRYHGYDKVKWPGFVIIVFCAAVMWLVPADVWWGTVLYWGAFIWLGFTIFHLWTLYARK